MLQLYPVMSLLALSQVAIGVFFLIWDLRALSVLFWFLCLAMASLGLFWCVRWSKSVLAVYRLERRFVQLLISRHSTIESSPPSYPLSFRAQVFLLIVPGALLGAGAIRAIPALGIPFFLGFAALMARLLSTKGAQDLPDMAWRLLLTDWVDANMIMRYSGLLAVGLFTSFVALTVVLHSSKEIIDPEDFLRATQWQIPLDIPGGIPQNALVASRVLLQGAMERPVVKESYPHFLWSLQSMRVVLCGIALFLLAGGFKSMFHWLRVWAIAKPGQGLALPPPARAVPSTRHPSVLLGIGARLALGGLMNVLHLGLAVEALSVLLTGRAVIAPPVARSIAWMLMDVDAAARGVGEMNPLGVVFVVVLISPTALTIVGWLSFAIRNLLSGLWRRALAPVSPSLTATATRQALALGIRRPIVRLTRGEAPRLETRVPWLFGRSTILVTRSAAEILSKPELDAALAHEVAHIKYDATALRCTRWLSLFSLFPCNVFAVLLDTPARERRADETAARLTGSTSSLAASLVRASLGTDFVVLRRNARAGKRRGRRLSPQAGGCWGQVVTYLRLLGSLFQPDLLLGYAHPRVQDRLHALGDGQKGPRSDADQRS